MGSQLTQQKDKPPAHEEAVVEVVAASHHIASDDVNLGDSLDDLAARLGKLDADINSDRPKV
jgi:hypothetical protein